MKIYIDSDYCCHVQNDGTMAEVEVDGLDGMCRSYVEGYRYIPEGETWTRSDGVQFLGAMLAPAEDIISLLKAQEQYELDKEQMSDMQNALAILGVTE